MRSKTAPLGLVRLITGMSSNTPRPTRKWARIKQQLSPALVEVVERGAARCKVKPETYLSVVAEFLDERNEQGRKVNAALAKSGELRK